MRDEISAAYVWETSCGLYADDYLDKKRPVAQARVLLQQHDIGLVHEPGLADVFGDPS